MRLRSIGDRVRHGTYRVHSRFRRVVNLLDGHNLASVVGADIGAGPINLVLSGVDLPGIESLTVGREVLTLDGRSCRIDHGRYYDSAVAIDSDRPLVLDRNLALLGRVLAGAAPPRSLAFLLRGNGAVPSGERFERIVLERLSEGAARIFQGDVIGGVMVLRGCGFGLTPSGDDFLAGMMTALHLIRGMFGIALGEVIEAVHRSCRTGNILSDVLLTLAAEGRISERMKNLIAAVLYGTEEQVQRHTRRLLLMGDASGADLATGFCLTMQRRELFVPSTGSHQSIGCHRLLEGGSG